jgi:hypothetical protein
MTSARIWFQTARMEVARAGVGVAVVLGMVGWLMTFVPGAEAGWFGVAALAALAGLLSPTRRLRVVAVVLAVALAAIEWDGHVRGRQCRERLRQQPGLSSAPAPRAP